MADRNKFEQMLELLVNEDKDAAEKLFHEIVVEKSRDIYEGLLEDDKDVDESSDEEVDEASDEEVDEATDEEVDEASDEEVDEASDEEVDEASDDEDLDENFNLDEFEVEADPMDVGGDETGDLAADLGMDMDDGDAEEEAGVEDRVEDLEDALDDLKAEFEKMMAGDDDGGEEADDGEEADMDMDADDGEEEPEEAFAFEAADEDDSEEADDDDDAKKESKTNQTAGEQMREYVEKVSATMGDNGANTKSSVANPNNMGGTASNLNQGSEEKGGDHTGLGDASPKDQDGGNVNVPGGKASKSLKAAPGHGAEKKGKPEAAADKKSLIGSK
jgi:E3 ubiquitin-protein ligase HUWE1